MLMSMLMAKLHYFRVPMACLWDTLYMNSHKHAQYMYQHSVICSWVCLWPNCIIFVCLWRAYETPYIGILISTPSIYMYQHSVICSWAFLWPNCIIFVCLSACLWDTVYRVFCNMLYVPKSSMLMSTTSITVFLFINERAYETPK
jgi:hypothetical protein